MFIIVKSTKGFVFGEYTPLRRDNSGCINPDSSAFMFSLTNPSNKPTKMQFKANNKQTSNGPNCGCGGGCDLKIFDSYNSRLGSKQCYVIPNSYVYPDEINGDKNGGEWMHGGTSKDFQIHEAEVFQFE